MELDYSQYHRDRIVPLHIPAARDFARRSFTDADAFARKRVRAVGTKPMRARLRQLVFVTTASVPVLASVVTSMLAPILLAQMLALLGRQAAVAFAAADDLFALGGA